MRAAIYALISVLGVYLILTTTAYVVRTNDLVNTIRDDQETNQRRSRQADENTARIKTLVESVKSCTTPDGECFKNSEDSVKVIVAFSSACAAQTPMKGTPDRRAKQIRACVDQLLAANPPGDRR